MNSRIKVAALSLLVSGLCFSGQIMAFEAADDHLLGDDLADFYGDEDFVSIATGSKKAIHKAPSVASVITQADIKEMGATTLDDVLQRVPGLHVSFSNISRLDSVYSIRGIQTGFNPQILVLLNGVEFKVPYSGGLPYTFRYPLNAIERIEVIRGPGSALYGADAFSGVINIITKSTSAEGSYMGGRAGSFSSRDIWARIENTFDDGYWNVNFEKQVSDGDSGRLVSADLQTTLDGIFATSASLAPASLSTRYDVNNLQSDVGWKNWRWQNWYWQQSDGGLGPGGAQAIDPQGYQEFDMYRTVLSFESSLSDNTIFKSQVSYLNQDIKSYFNLFPAGAILPIGADGNVNFNDVAGITLFSEGYIGVPISEESSLSFKFGLTWNGLQDHKLTFGTGYSEASIDARELKNFGPGVIDGSQPVVDGTLTDVTGTPFIYMKDTSRDVRYFLIQDEWNPANDWELTMGVRYDDFSDFGSSTNPRAALVWQAGHNLTIKALYGTAFRAPAFNEMFLINNPAALGNPNVKPEEIDTTELALVYNLNFNTRIAFNIYQYKAKDLIDKVATVEGLVTDNVRDQDGQGYEAELDWTISDEFTLYFNYSHHQSEDADTDLDIADAPGQLAYFDIRYSLEASFKLSSQLYWVADRLRMATDPRESLDDDFMVNFKASWELNQKTFTAFTVKNVFDNDAAEPSDGRILNDYQREGRSVWLELEQHF